MTQNESMQQLWLETRARLAGKGLLSHAQAALSVRCPEGNLMWFGMAFADPPLLIDWRDVQSEDMAGIHAAVYRARGDAGAVLWGGGSFSACLDDFGGELPQVFDEQARHIGAMPPPVADSVQLAPALDAGGNALLWRGIPLCIGTTCTRLALNVELLEKCAKAYVLAVSAGGLVRQLPWLVRHIANGRLSRDEKRAAQAFARGTVPLESKAY